MATITEDYVSIETAKLLKKKGFDADISIPHAVYSLNDGTFINLLQFIGNTSFINYNLEKCVVAPTLQMAIKWLREVHKLEVTPFHEVFQGSSWWYLIERNTSLSLLTEYEEDAVYGSYEQAAEAGIKYCLEKLIK